MSDGQWDIVISSLQDIYNANEVTQFDDNTTAKRANFENLPDDQLQSYLNEFHEHMENVNRAKLLLDSVGTNLQTILDRYEVKPTEETLNPESEEVTAKTNAEGETEGRQYWISQYNSTEPIVMGSEIAYKPRKGGDGEWFQCEVIKVSPDGLKFEVRDPEPDEVGNTGKIFKCAWKELILIPTIKNANIKTKVINYPPGTKVLGRYPETTTFYPAVVIGNKRDGTCRLRFDGEEEVNKETEVLRRLVLPFPMSSSTPAKK